MKTRIQKSLSTCAIAAIALACVPFSHAGVVTYIDMLATRQTNTTYNSSMTNTIPSATSLGAFRTVTLTSVGNDINDESSVFRVMTNAPAGPRAVLTSGTDATPAFEMKWGGAGGTAGLGGVDFTGAWGTDFSLTKSTLNFSLLTASITNSVTWTFIDTSNNTATYTQSIPVNLTPSPAIDYAVSLASFTGSGIIDWTSINFITLAGGGVPSLNMTFAAPFSSMANNIPEPGTWAAAGILLLATLYIRRRRARATDVAGEAPAAA